MTETAPEGPGTPMPVVAAEVWVLMVALHEDRRFVGAKADFAPGVDVELGRGCGRFTLQRREERSGKSTYVRDVARVLDSQRISARHVQLAFEPNVVRLWNMSGNGTLVNGRPASPAQELTDLDVLTVGPCVLLLRRTHWIVPEPDDPFIVGRSEAIHKLLRDIQQAAGVPTLIRGEMGVGKELVADALWKSAKTKAIKRYNCAFLRSELSELSGHVKNIFNGAEESVGILEDADGCTLFLDEVADLEPRAQAQLLRFLQEGEVQRLGSKVAKKVKVHVIAASNADFEQRIAAGSFRGDLYYRLRKTEIAVPTLRERKEDIPLLFQRFIEAERAAKVPVSRTLMVALLRHDWPGNVRELRSTVEHLVGAARKVHEADPRTPMQIRMTDVLEEHLSRAARGTPATSTPPPASATEAAPPTRAPEKSARPRSIPPKAGGSPPIEELEEGIRAAGNKRAYAKQLGVSRATLYRWLGPARPDSPEGQEEDDDG